jgi:hypothetical protein
MVMFIVGKLWLFALVSGLILLFPRQSRFLAAYLLVGSTLGLLLAFVCMGIVSQFLGAETSLAPLAMAAGGILGVVAGSRIALKLNVVLGWQAQQK